MPEMYRRKLKEAAERIRQSQTHAERETARWALDLLIDQMRHTHPKLFRA